MKLSNDALIIGHIPVIRKKTVSNKSSTPKYDYGTIEYVDHTFMIKYKGKRYNLNIPDSYCPIVLFSTPENNYWSLNTPSRRDGLKQMKDISIYWSPVHVDMKVPVYNNNNELHINLIALEDIALKYYHAYRKQ